MLRFDQYAKHCFKFSMAFSGIQGHKLEITVVGCNQLKDTWYGHHKPYVALLYGTSSHRTKTSRDGGKNPTFNEKFEFSLIEELHELNIHVFSSHNIMDSFIGHGKVNLDKVFREGYNVTLVPLESLTGRQAGEVNLILQYFPIANIEQQHGATYSQQSFAPQGSSVYPPQYGAQPHFVAQGSPYPPQCEAQASSAPQGSPSYTQNQEAPAQAPRYTKQDLHDARMRMIDAQIRRSSESAERMSAIGTNSQWERVHYTNRYEDSIDRMNFL